jgi:hypothetical protein
MSISQGGQYLHASESELNSKIYFLLLSVCSASARGVARTVCLDLDLEAKF